MEVTIGKKHILRLVLNDRNSFLSAPKFAITLHSFVLYFCANVCSPGEGPTSLFVLDALVKNLEIILLEVEFCVIYA